MSVKVHEAFSIDSFQDRLLWWDDFLGDQLKDEWRETGDAGGSAVIVDAQTGGIVRITTDTDDTDNWEIDWGNIRSLLVANKVSIEYRVRYNDLTNLGMELGLFYDNQNEAFFDVADTAASTNIIIRTNLIGTPTTADSGVDLDDTDYHIYRIECHTHDGTNHVHFYIDGTHCDNSPITTNIPVLHLQPRVYVKTQEDMAKSMDVDYVVVRQEI